MSVEKTSEKGQSKSVGSGSSGSASGFWRSARGENHGRDSRPGDVWVEPGDITDTDRLDWLLDYIQRNGTDAMIEVWGHSKGGPLGRDAIDGAILSQNP